MMTINLIERIGNEAEWPRLADEQEKLRAAGAELQPAEKGAWPDFLCGRMG